MSKSSKNPKKVKSQYRDSVKVMCEHCKKEFTTSDYGLLCFSIMEHKLACSYECNKALGQAR